MSAISQRAAPAELDVALRAENAKNKERRTTRGGAFYYIYYFDCSKCGAPISAQHVYLKTHSGKCRSCCQKKGSDFFAAYRNLVRCAKKRGHVCTLTENEYIKIRNTSVCHYCNDHVPHALGRGQPGYRGYFLDRKDNSQGYTPENSVLCCWRCNQAKGDRYTYEEWQSIVALLRSRRNGLLWGPIK